MFGFDLVEIIKTVGYLGIFAIVFAESGLLVGFFLPGDSLLFTAGLLASQIRPGSSETFFSLPVLIVGCFIAAVAGDQVGYWFGHRVGRSLFDRPNSRFFRKKYLVSAEKFYLKHGGKTIILARFMPFVRTFAPIVAGTAAMPYGQFTLFNVIGGALWTVGLTVGGYFLGSIIPDPDRYLLPVLAVIIFVSILPSLLHVWRDRHELFGRKSAEPEGKSINQ